MNTNIIAIIGAGVMGAGIALNLALFSCEVILIDANTEVLEDVKKNIPNELRMIKMRQSLIQDISAEEILKFITFSNDYTLLKNAELIIENIPENWDLKKALYEKIDPLLSENTIVAINTSCIAITQAAACFSKPNMVIGAHFMNPAPLKEIVEVIKGFHTSEETVKRLKMFLTTINKKAILVNDAPGFVANRLSHLFMNEAAFLLQEQIASARDIDSIFTKGYGHAMGPLATADLIGLDTVVNSLEILYTNYQDSKFRCCPLLKKMVYAGLLGRKSGEGFFKY